MGYCTGTGETNGDHCCYVDGMRCPHLLTEAEALAWINAQLPAQGWNNPTKNTARSLVQGVPWNCKIAMKVAALNSNARSNRSTFNQLWDNDPEYLITPAPAWRALEQAQGLPVNSFQCSTWKGDGPASCCFRHTTAESDAIVAQRGISTTAVNIRKAGGRAD